MSVFIHLSMHAIDRASQRLFDEWLRDHPGRERGIANWLLAGVRPVVDEHERAGTLGALRFISVRGVCFPIDFEREKNRVVVKTAIEGLPRVNLGGAAAMSKPRNKAGSLKKTRAVEQAELEDSGWSEDARRGDR